MFFGAIYLTLKELQVSNLKSVFERMRIKRLTGIDYLWMIGGLVVLSFLSFLIAKFLLPVFDIDAIPFLFKNIPLSKLLFWILYVWLIFFFFNIFGEELL